MDKQLTLLEAALANEVAAYRALVSRLPFKIALIKKNRVDQLERLTAQEEADLKRLSDLEKARTDCVQSLLPSLPKGVEPSLSGLLPFLSPAWQARLSALGKTLQALVGSLREGNQACAFLLRASLETVDYTMQLVGRAVVNAQPVLYGNAPEVVHSPSLLLDWRA